MAKNQVKEFCAHNIQKKYPEFEKRENGEKPVNTGEFNKMEQYKQEFIEFMVA